MNFALLLVLLSFITGIIYLFDVLFWAKKRAPEQKPGKIIEYSRSFFPVFFWFYYCDPSLLNPSASLRVH